MVGRYTPKKEAGMMDLLFTIILLVVIGAGSRTVYRFALKIIKNPDTAFEKKYLLTMLLSILLTITAAPLLLLNVTIPHGSDLFIQISMFCIGWTANDIINPIVSLASNIIHDLRAIIDRQQRELEKRGSQQES